jgi:hypothetical protein
MSETKILSKDTRTLSKVSADARKYFRKWARTAVSIPAKVEIRLEDGTRFTTGTAIIRDISLKGARLGKIVLRKQVLPAANFRIQMHFRSDQYEGIGAVCRPIRFGQGKEFEIAVEFEDLWADEEK